MIKTSELQDLSVNELLLQHQDISKELYHLRNEKKISKKMEKPHLMREKRRDRARVLTVMHQKLAAKARD